VKAPQVRPLLLVALTALTPLAACSSSSRSSPYAPLSESERDGDKARKLNAEAAKLMDSNPAKAEKLLREALTADLYAGAAHNNLGIILLRDGDLFGAAGEFEWGRKLLPGLPEPRLNLALTLERAGRTDEALATYATALEVYPDYIPAIEATAELEVRSGKADEHTRKLLDEISLRGESERWREWARVQLAKSNGH
jgi:tetratricopeptide (TPR) repeat protein